ncbi:MAG: hypothetical protein A2898_02105 [Candidatus Kerfeldbacteria bacterium RIFCSPLOWO2_01_FULL_48_11]|uniref:Uncharacterized protein n=1 Tax=Candidatus Kerfeldbacteria bacterium RIFCSPLOWO2_01_FULL_48_11 TaxID=1798543 RepID=A0A1G2B4F3_9BACT|nr:MAG: hypothetical protein UY34_C0019G0007 [Parcubacteria group bacterium GW2011_GWA2_48_9]KKW16085.1 MAG: hypothetical protein UY52_C0011G0073 [Parcubacteria group bacterium GW2011_GWC2_49_9]OGY84038.1 MAG: hypothetical protein A2898_02105 [Candidatus Kerfeldbacteria bacterium RIFCSPLOWO2_01_FULL_48_11]
MDNIIDIAVIVGTMGLIVYFSRGYLWSSKPYWLAKFETISEKARKKEIRSSLVIGLLFLLVSVVGYVDFFRQDDLSFIWPAFFLAAIAFLGVTLLVNAYLYTPKMIDRQLASPETYTRWRKYYYVGFLVLLMVLMILYAVLSQEKN